MRALSTRGRSSVPALLLAVFLYCALGVLVTCHVADSVPRAGAIDRVAVTAPLPGASSCPDCVPGPDEARWTGSEGAAGGLRGSLVDPCHPDRPCQHGATHGYSAAASNPRAPDPATHVISAAPLLFGLPSRAGPGPARACSSGPVPPPAVREPVAVLCVDRN